MYNSTISTVLAKNIGVIYRQKMVGIQLALVGLPLALYLGSASVPSSRLTISPITLVACDRVVAL